MRSYPLLVKSVLIIILACLLGGWGIFKDTTFTPYQGSNQYPAGSGSVKTVDGIDIWTTGDPDKRYKVIGIIEQSHRKTVSATFSFLTGMGLESELVEVAKKNGADAVVALSEKSQITGLNTRGTYAESTSTTRYAAVQYIKTEKYQAIFSDDESTTYLDNDSIKSSSDFASVYMVVDMKTPKRFSEDKPAVLSVQSKWVFDCQANKVKVSSADSYSGNMLNGSVVSSDIDPTAKWNDIQSNTVSEKIKQLACKS